MARARANLHWLESTPHRPANTFRSSSAILLRSQALLEYQAKIEPWRRWLSGDFNDVSIIEMCKKNIMSGRVTKFECICGNILVKASKTPAKDFGPSYKKTYESMLEDFHSWAIKQPDLKDNVWGPIWSEIERFITVTTAVVTK